MSGATATTYVYDASGNLAAEYTSPPSACGTPTCYVSVDQIGSTRVVTDSNGNVTQRYDFLPSGEELWAGIGDHTTAMGYQASPDGFNPKFTGQMRDTESQLDYFNARYYSPQQGRFVSPDPENAGANPTNTQTWNGYAYVGNNPLTITDPSGEDWEAVLFGIIEFIAGFEVGPAIPWLVGLGEAATVGATAAAADLALPDAVNNGSIAGIAGLFLGGFEIPDYSGLGGGVNTGGVYGGGSTGPFVFSLEDADRGGFWTVDYNGNPYWYVPTSHTSTTGAQLRAAPKPSKLSVAGSCTVASFEDHWLGLSAATAAGPVPKPLLGERSNWVQLDELG